MIISFLNINNLFITVLLLELLLLLTLMCMKRVLVDSNTIFLATGFTQKMPESSDSMYFSNSCEKIYGIILPEVDRIRTNCGFYFNLVRFPRDP